MVYSILVNLFSRIFSLHGVPFIMQLRNLELLKLRFGESNLYFCEVMVKDIVDSKRINTHVVSQLDKERQVSNVTVHLVDVDTLFSLF